MKRNVLIGSILLFFVFCTFYLYFSTHYYVTFIDDCVMHSTLERCNFIWERMKK